MRAFLTTIVGGPGRVAVTAVALVVIGAVLSGSVLDFLWAVWVAGLAASAFLALYAILAVFAAAAGVCDGTSAPTTGEADHG